MKYTQGIYQPRNPEKYHGACNPTYRSSWEKKMFANLDEHASVLAWASECIKIPYQDPFTGQSRNYIPDLMIRYVDANNQQHVEVVEIKPLAESLLERARSSKQQAAFVLNSAKWAAARSWCAAQGMQFRVITEADIFGQPGKSS